jgi:hypothetical protein
LNRKSVTNPLHFSCNKSSAMDITGLKPPALVTSKSARRETASPI